MTGSRHDNVNSFPTYPQSTVRSRPDDPPKVPRVTGRNGSLDAIRLLAASLVFASHVGWAIGVPGLIGLGAWGVALFFVLSGYLIPTVYAKGGPYFSRRLLRILPGYWFAVFGLGLLYPIQPAAF